MSIKIVKKGIVIRRINILLKEIKELKRFYLLELFLFVHTYNVLVKSCITLGGTFMLEGKGKEEQDEIEELKTYSISEYVKMRKEKSKERNKHYEEKLKVLKEKTDRLKKQIDYE